MLQSYFPIYQIAIDLEKLRRTAAIYKGGYSREVDKSDAKDFLSLLEAMQRDCLALGLIPPTGWQNASSTSVRQKATPLCLRTLVIWMAHLLPHWRRMRSFAFRLNGKIILSGTIYSGRR